jgi:predicted RNA polymerase sigma factor
VSATDPHHATHQALHRTIEAVWRIESARVIAGLTRLTRDVGLADKHIPFEVPHGPELATRLSSVLEVIYLTFNEGYSATTGDDLMRPTLCEDALRLGRILAELTPTEPEVHGLVALMEIQASRTRARVTSTGELVLLFDQNRTQWDQLLIHRGLTAIERAHKINTTRCPYLLQAEIAACRARARTPSETDWPRIVILYTELAQLIPFPVIELNRAVAVSMAHGLHAGLTLVDALASEPSLARYHLLPSVRAALQTRPPRRSPHRVRTRRRPYPQHPRTRPPPHPRRILRD